MQKLVYQTCYDTGVYLGVAYADRDPEVPERWAIPGACVLVPPPPAPLGYVPRWNGEEWELFKLPPPPAPPRRPAFAGLRWRLINWLLPRAA